ncbi:uncharacterized protein LOC114545330 [Perca flavescens]|uniref:uncharacterized protein LOC114545330 n=1 Tax=Perca flavescens TaxID=8167 RepID=UPI00106DE3B1|nr:uncharacterized protein LOC114545330 [Perca flavescens]
MFGWEARYPIDIPTEYEITHDYVALVAEERLSSGLQALPEHFAIAQQNMERARERVKRKREELGHDDEFKVGDRQNIRQEQRKGGKMEKAVIGPFIITNIEGKSVDVVSQKGKIHQKINMDQLRYIDPTPRIPHKWSGPSASMPSTLSADESPCHSEWRVSPCHTPSFQSPPSYSPAHEGPLTSLRSPVQAVQPATDPLETVLHNIWAREKGEILWCKAGPYKLFSHNLREHLGPGKLLESEVINSYLHITLSDCTKAGKRVFLIDSYQMSNVWQGKNKGLKKVDPLDNEVMVGAVCDHNHWTLMAMYPHQRRSIYLDPFGASTGAIKRCGDVSRSGAHFVGACSTGAGEPPRPTHGEVHCLLCF